MVRINGLFHLLINGVFFGVKSPTDPITIDPFTSVPGHPRNWNEVRGTATAGIFDGSFRGQRGGLGRATRRSLKVTLEHASKR